MPAADSLSVGAHFGPWDDKFKILKVLDRGSQGEVFVCKRLSRGKEYAVKRIDVGTLEMRHKRSKVRVNLKREIDIMRELTHERIVNLLEAYWDGVDVCFIVMDLAQGGSLHDKLLPDVGLNGGELASRHVARQLLEGIGYMHEHRVVHRDLKPQNVLIARSLPSAEGDECELHDVKIADFGLSRCLQSVGGQNVNMTAVGTPAFAAPEVLTGDYDEKADFWSFGCILYTTLCGEYPFDECPDHIRHPEKYKDGKVTPEVTDCASWRKVSEPGKAIVLGLLRVQATDRLGHNGCLRHPWINGEKECTPHTLSSSESPLSPKRSSNTFAAPSIRAPVFFGCMKWPPWGQQGPPKGLSVQSVKPKGVVSSIKGWTGSAVDSLEISMHGGNKLKFGSSGGVKESAWTLRSNECIIAVRHELGNRFMGAGIVFYTSTGQIIALQGTDAGKRRRFVTLQGTQVVGLQFESNHLSGILMQKLPVDGQGSVEKITGKVGYAVDSLAFHMRDGTTNSYGGKGGSMDEEYPVAQDEYIVIVEHGHRDGYIGNSISMYMSSGRIIVFKGMAAARSLRFMSPAGRQICGVKFEDSGEGYHRISCVSTCPLNADPDCTVHHNLDEKNVKMN